MKIEEMIEEIKRHPRYREVGMILTHTGVVRGHSRDGSPVSEVEVKADRNALLKVVDAIKSRPGIVEILVDIREGRLRLGEEIMHVAVAGDIRENGFAALMETVNRIKAEVTRKVEF